MSEIISANLVDGETNARGGLSVVVVEDAAVDEAAEGNADADGEIGETDLQGVEGVAWFGEEGGHGGLEGVVGGVVDGGDPEDEGGVRMEDDEEGGERVREVEVLEIFGYRGAGRWMDGIVRKLVEKGEEWSVEWTGENGAIVDYLSRCLGED